jgi:hypothetical protein
MSETNLKNSLHNLDYELYSEDYSMNQLWQFGSKSEEEINAEIEENVSNNTKKTRESIWKQFSRLHSFVKNNRWDHEWEYSVQFFETMVTNV